MERERAYPSLHRRLMSALVRGAEAQEASREVIAEQLALDERVIATLEQTRVRREERARQRNVRNQTRR